MDYFEQSIVRADQMLDAEAGYTLLQQMEDDWFMQGVRAVDPSLLWNNVQRAGYHYAQAVQDRLCRWTFRELPEPEEYREDYIGL